MPSPVYLSSSVAEGLHIMVHILVCVSACLLWPLYPDPQLRHWWHRGHQPLHWPMTISIASCLGSC